VEHPRIVEIVREAWQTALSPEVALLEEEGSVAVSRYTDADRLALERARLFRAMPIPIAHSAELDTPVGTSAGAVLVRELDGVSLLLTRTADGRVHAHRNACRHRGVRLLREDCRKKALVCPYHAWTYRTDGALEHVPHPQAFPSCDKAKHGLVPVPVEERHGLVWVTLDSGPDVRAHLGELDDEIAALGLDRHVVGGRSVRAQRGNWKFLMEAFLDGYHIRTLHRDSVYPFFLDGRSVAHRVGAHIRAATARRAAREVKDEAALLARPLREVATFNYAIFPCVNLIAHPDWTSLVVVLPLATDRFLWSHMQLLPEAPSTDSARAHFERSFELIEGNVFQGEDLLMISEQQDGIESGANAFLTFGRLESAALWFHEAIDRALGPATEPPRGP
jgi:phenylpropionate dioxygenase-like ring-hydroxylating dioxygenase large terminal subunit